MSKNSSPPRPKPRRGKASVPHCPLKYTEKSLSMMLADAQKYFRRCFAEVFLVNKGAYCPSCRGREGVGLAKGDIFIVCVTKELSFLKLRSASSGNDSVIVPVTSRSEFALTPLCEEGVGTDVAVRSWEGEFESVTEFYQARKGQGMPVPAALKVLKTALDHNRQKVPANTILFNIRLVRHGLRKRKGIQGVDPSGTVHRFLEGEDLLYFSTKLNDVKCIPMYFSSASVLQFPQTARVYLHPNTEEEEEGEVNLLQNLSTVTITEIGHGHYLVVRKLTESGDELGRAFTVPWDADLMVTAINLKDSLLLDQITDQRRLVKSKSTSVFHSQADDDANTYSNDPSEATRGDLQAGGKEDPDKGAYYNAKTSKQHHDYVNIPGAGFVPRPSHTDRTAPGTSHQYYNMMRKTEPLDESSDYIYMQDDSKRNAMAPCGKMQPPYPGNPSQSLAVSGKYQKSGAASLESSPVMQRRKQHSSDLHFPHSLTHSLKQGRGIDERPTEEQLFHHVARKVGAEWRYFVIYLGFEDARIQQADREKSFASKVQDILVNWRKGAGKIPKTWATILAALESAGLIDLASEIQKDIEGGTLI